MNSTNLKTYNRWLSVQPPPELVEGKGGLRQAQPTGPEWLHQWLILLLLAHFLFLGCAQASVAIQPPVNLSIAGSTAFFPVLFDLTEAFSDRYPNVVFDVRGGGSGFGELQLAQGKIDLAATTYLVAAAESRPLNIANNSASNLADNLASNLADNSNRQQGVNESVRIPIGLDGVAILVHRNNRIESLTLVELQDIYSGRILDWKELGETPGEIQLVIREDGSGARDLFESRVMGDKQVSLTAAIMPTNADVLRYVALYPGAIGYISRGYTMSGKGGDTIISANDEAVSLSASRSGVPNAYLDSLASELARVTTVAIDGQLPTIEQILGQQYYLVHPLYLMASDEPSGWLSLFIDFALSPSGQEIVGRYHAPVR